MATACVVPSPLVFHIYNRLPARRPFRHYVVPGLYPPEVPPGPSQILPVKIQIHKRRKTCVPQSPCLIGRVLLTLQSSTWLLTLSSPHPPCSEDTNGVRLSWNVIPTSRIEATRMVRALRSGCMMHTIACIRALVSPARIALCARMGRRDLMVPVELQPR